MQQDVQQQQRSATPARRATRLQVLSTPRGGTAATEQQQTKRAVVVAVDGSEDSLVAFNYVIENVLKRGEDHVHLLHVVPDLFTSPASGSIHYCSSPDPETERALWHQTQQFFEDHFVAHAKCCGLGDSVTLHLVKESKHKHIGKAVCAKAEELGAEPLVVAAHDKGPIEELLLGSTSKYVAAHCKRPVLLLHPNHSNI